MRSGPAMFQHLCEEVKLSLFQTLKPSQCPVKTYFVDLSFPVSVTNSWTAFKSFDPSIIFFFIFAEIVGFASIVRKARVVHV